MNVDYEDETKFDLQTKQKTLHEGRPIIFC
jgi:hypothetical protein